MVHALMGDIGLGAYALAAAVVCVAALLQSVTGMGFGLTAAPVLALVDPRLVPSSILFLGMLIAGMAAVRGRADIDLREIGIALIGRIVGAVLAGTTLAAVADTSLVSLMFAALVLIAVGLSVSTWHVRLTPVSLLAAGVSSGFMGTVTAIGAPPMGVVYQHAPAPKVRATLNGFFALGTLASIGSLAWYGLFTTEHVVRALALLPALAVGFWLSRRVAAVVDTRRLRPMILAICVVSSLAIAWKALA